MSIHSNRFFLLKFFTNFYLFRLLQQCFVLNLSVFFFYFQILNDFAPHFINFLCLRNLIFLFLTLLEINFLLIFFFFSKYFSGKKNWNPFKPLGPRLCSFIWNLCFYFHTHHPVSNVALDYLKKKKILFCMRFVSNINRN